MKEVEQEPKTAKSWAGKTLLAGIRLIPWKARSFVYRIPVINTFLRRLLVKIAFNGKYSTVTISAGPLKGYRIKIKSGEEKFYWLATHEPSVQTFLAKSLLPGTVAYDIGAHIGYFTVLLSSLCGERGRVLAFEPQKDNYQRLIDNIALNNLVNVRAFPLAVSDRRRAVWFEENKDSFQGRLIHSPSADPERAGQMYRVGCVSLDEFVFRQNHPPPGVIKIDVEGEEARVIDGMKGVLEKIRPRIICELHGPESGTAVWNKLKFHQYRLYDIRNTSKPIEKPVNRHALHILALPA